MGGCAVILVRIMSVCLFAVFCLGMYLFVRKRKETKRRVIPGIFVVERDSELVLSNFSLLFFKACKDCEFRLPGGGYRMADQSASRPKWIPTYDERSFSGQNKEHISKWKTALFSCDESGVTKAEFVESLVQLDFATPLGGPFLSKSAGSKMDDTSTVAVEYLFDVLTEGKTETLTYRKMSRRLKVLSKNEEGLTWPNFSAALGIN